MNDDTLDALVFLNKYYNRYKKDQKEQETMEKQSSKLVEAQNLETQPKLVQTKLIQSTNENSKSVEARTVANQQKMIQTRLFPSTPCNSQGRHISVKQNQTPARRIPPRKRALRPNVDISSDSDDSNLQDIKSVFNL